jgi:hypothetical protein
MAARKQGGNRPGTKYTLQSPIPCDLLPLTKPYLLIAHLAVVPSIDYSNDKLRALLISTTSPAGDQAFNTTDFLEDTSYPSHNSD